ncbi:MULTISPECIES: hypothetical protein [Haloferax]|uniref:hypothetical protein n=1 Tax=Haloferax TaxID=2251 RepID=UPI001784C040|nr:MULTISPECIES: hypothetical protein [Haloferax]
MEGKRTGDDRVWALAFGLTLVTMPAVTLILAFAVLSATQSAIVEQLTPLELVELYVVELVAFALFSYILYRLAQYAWARHDELASERETVESETVTNADPVDQEASQ